MKKSILPLFLGGSVIIALSLVTRCGSDPETAANSDSTSPDSLCFADPSWFPHTQTPAPAEGDGSPFDTSSTTNQIFHQWSWQKFLWLTKPDKGGNPLFLNQDIVRQVTSDMQLVTIPTGTLLKIQDVNQAGSKQAILQTNPQYNKEGKSETVYYSIHMNHLMYSEAKKYAALIHAGKLPDAAQKSFPVGSFELKVAWVPVTAIPADKQKLYYTAMASLSTDGGKTFKNTQMALIGMHVVGVVKNHPEFIWATFEHDELGPNYNWKDMKVSNTDEKLLCKKASSPTIDGIIYDTSTKLGKIQHMVFDLFQYGVPRSNGGDFMANTSQSEPVNFQNIDGINKCVKSQLDDVWKNYFYNGSIWLNMDGTDAARQAFIIDSLGGNIGNATKGSYARGSLNCANITMETFTQTFESDISGINVNTLANCFSCHSGQAFDTTMPPASPLYLSHTFQDYVTSLRNNNSKARAESIKLLFERRLQMRMEKK